MNYHTKTQKLKFDPDDSDKFDLLGLMNGAFEAENNMLVLTKRTKDEEFEKEKVYRHGIEVGYIKFDLIFIDASFKDKIESVLPGELEVWKRNMGITPQQISSILNVDYVGAGFKITFHPNERFISRNYSGTWTQSTSGEYTIHNTNDWRDDTNITNSGNYTHVDFPGFVPRQTLFGVFSYSLQDYSTYFRVCGDVVYKIKWSREIDITRYIKDHAKDSVKVILRIQTE